MGEDSASDCLVGGTIFVRSRNIEPLVSCKKLFLKFEGGNPTGTQKDRAAIAVIQRAKEAGYDELSIGTCGNFGASFAFFSRKFGMKTHVFIPSSYRAERVEEIQHYDGMVHRVDGTYEDALDICSEEAETYNWYDANPGKNENSEISMAAYAGISEEIYSSLGRVPDAVSVPVGNGTTLAGIYRGFRFLHESGKTDGVPMMIASSTAGGNPVIKSFKMGSRTLRDLEPEDIRETAVNEPLVSWHSFDGQMALDALYESNGFADYASDTRMKEFSRILMSEEGLSVLPASASSLVVLSEYLRKVHSPEYCVAILTGRQPYYLRNSKNEGKNNQPTHIAFK